MTDDARELSALIIAAAEAWLPLSAVPPGLLAALGSMHDDGLVEYWPDSPDGPAVTLTPLGAIAADREIHDRVEKRRVEVEAGDGAWWAPRAAPTVSTVRNEVVPKWGDPGESRPVRWPRHQREVPLWFPESVPDHREGPAEEAARREVWFLMGRPVGGEPPPVPAGGLAGGFGAASGKDVPAAAPVARRVKRNKGGRKPRRAG